MSTLRLDGKSLDLVAEGLDLASELGSLVGVDRGSNDRTADTTGAAEHVLAGDVDVGSALVLAQEGNVQQDGEGLGVGGQDGNLAGTAVQGLGDLVGSLLGLADVSGRLEEIEDLLGKSGIGQGPGCENVSCLPYFGFCDGLDAAGRICYVPTFSSDILMVGS